MLFSWAGLAFAVLVYRLPILRSHELCGAREGRLSCRGPDGAARDYDRPLLGLVLLHDLADPQQLLCARSA